MSETLDITTEQINDRPLLWGIVEDMGIRRMIDARIQPHGGWQGISVGTIVGIWLCYILMERDHRLVSVRDWAPRANGHWRRWWASRCARRI